MKALRKTNKYAKSIWKPQVKLKNMQKAHETLRKTNKSTKLDENLKENKLFQLSPKKTVVKKKLS